LAYCCRKYAGRLVHGSSIQLFGFGSWFGSISPLIGAIVGAFISSSAADKVITYMNQKNSGVYDPEFRLVIVVVPLILGGMSFFLTIPLI
jgi:hypothetical protein